MRAINIYLSENAVVDSQDNSLSLINLLDDISSPTFPLFLPKISITSILEKEIETSDDFDCFINCKLNDSELHKIPLKVSFRGTPRSRSIIKINGFLIPSPGILKFELEHNGGILISTELIVRVIGGLNVDHR